MRSLRELLNSGRPIFGTWISMQDSSIIEFAKWAGFDFVRLDCEYMPYDFSKIAEMIRVSNNLGIPIMVRIARLEDIDMIVNFGANAIIVPDCNTIERAKEAIEKVKYFPQGARSMYTASRALKLSGLSLTEYCKEANNYVMLNIQIEDIKAMEIIDDLLTLDGIDMISSGRGDISQSMGMPGQVNHSRVLEMEDKIIENALKHDKYPVMLSSSKEQVSEWYERGVRFFTIGKDENFLFNGMKECLSGMKSNIG
jgi:2-keto-3-deoxy-L-rhamnonate aldolase RhmA